MTEGFIRTVLLPVVATNSTMQARVFYLPHVVTKITTTQVFAGGRRFRKRDGREIGGDQITLDRNAKDESVEYRRFVGRDWNA